MTMQDFVNVINTYYHYDRPFEFDDFKSAFFVLGKDYDISFSGITLKEGRNTLIENEVNVCI